MLFVVMVCVSHTDDALCRKHKAKCSSLYTSGTCASNVLADSQVTLNCSSNPCVDGDTDDALCSKPKAKCSSLHTSGMCASDVLADNQGTLDCTSNLSGIPEFIDSFGW